MKRFFRSSQPDQSLSAGSQLPGERLQKVLAGAGYGSRRRCEELIVDGRVEVDRKVVCELGSRADIHSQEIRVDGELLSPPKLVYYLVNKPSGVVCTHRDPGGRMRVIDMVPDGDQLFTVGKSFSPSGTIFPFLKTFSPSGTIFPFPEDIFPVGNNF